jgi:hypothetical protein
MLTDRTRPVEDKLVREVSSLRQRATSSRSHRGDLTIGLGGCAEAAIIAEHRCVLGRRTATGSRASLC